MKNAGVNEVPCKVGPLTVVLNKVLQEAGDVKPSAEHTRLLLTNIRRYGPHMVIIREAVQMDQHLDRVALLEKVVRHVLVTAALAEDRVETVGLQRVQLRVEEGLRQPDFKDKHSSA